MFACILISLQRFYGRIEGADFPMQALAGQLSPVLSASYAVLLLAAMFNGALSCMVGTIVQLFGEKEQKKSITDSLHRLNRKDLIDKANTEYAKKKIKITVQTEVTTKQWASYCVWRKNGSCIGRTVIENASDNKSENLGYDIDSLGKGVYAQSTKEITGRYPVNNIQD